MAANNLAGMSEATGILSSQELGANSQFFREFQPIAQTPNSHRSCCNRNCFMLYYASQFWELRCHSELIHPTRNEVADLAENVSELNLLNMSWGQRFCRSEKGCFHDAVKPIPPVDVFTACLSGTGTKATSSTAKAVGTRVPG